MEDEDIHLSRGLMESEAEVKKQEKLDFFAGCALSGLIAGTMSVSTSGGQVLSLQMDWEEICEKAYEVAHVMMKTREADEDLD